MRLDYATNKKVPESKPARAIRRHNHGVVNKHGLIGAYFAERERKLWLESKGKPYMSLSSSGGS